MQIESGLYQRQGSAITNFETTLPQPQSDLARNLIKDPYTFDFLTLAQDAQEKELETALVSHMRDFLLELGVGFAFMGSQYPIEVSNKEYRLDLLFYHTRLRCYVIIDLKMGEYVTAAVLDCSDELNRLVTKENMTMDAAADRVTGSVRPQPSPGEQTDPRCPV